MVTRSIQEKNILGGNIYKRYNQRKSNQKQFQLINRDIVTPDEVFDAFIGFDDELAIDDK